MQKINEDMQILEELIRKAYSLISPLSIHQNLQWIMNKDARDNLFEKYPKCFLTLRKKGRDIPFFPICNRSGISDPDIIKFSMKLANRLKNRPEIEGEQIDAILVKLQNLDSKFSKEIPKPGNMVAKKALATKLMSKIRTYLDQVR